MWWSVLLLVLMGSFATGRHHRYHFIKEKMSWEEAQNYCRDKYTDLATITDMTDMREMTDMTDITDITDITDMTDIMRTTPDESWIGLHNQANKKTWHWSLPGLQYNKSQDNWGYTNPTDNCVFMRNEDGTWGDIPCQRPVKFACYNENDKTFHVIKEKKPFIEAQIYCREKYTDMVSGTQQLQDIMKLPLTIDILIGLFRDTWTWSDNSGFSFRRWHKGFNMDVDQGNDQCAMLAGETWNTDGCTEKKSFFCYNVPPMPDEMILVQEKKTWSEALYYCRDNHHDLVSITDLKEQRRVQEIVKSATTPYVWLGLHYSCLLNLWFWVDKRLVCYENWFSKDQEGCDKFGAMERGGKWVKMPDEEKFNFICARRK